MKIGDTVRFLKEVGGGRVSGFQDKNTVLVEDSDGFEIPMPISEVVVERGESYENGTWAKRKEEQKAKTPNTANRNSNDVTPLEKATEDKPEYHIPHPCRCTGEPGVLSFSRLGCILTIRRTTWWALLSTHI